VGVDILEEKKILRIIHFTFPPFACPSFACFFQFSFLLFRIMPLVTIDKKITEAISPLIAIRDPNIAKVP
jgi:hypothetical protein